MSKPKVAVVVDSTATLPQELRDEYDIHVIPQILNWEGETYRDGVDITPTEFYERLKSAKELPTTSQPSTGEFFEIFGEIAKTYESIVGVFISEYLSGTYACASAAAEMMEDYPIEIVDSRSASMGLGFMAVTAARSIQEGLSYSDAAHSASELVSGMKVMFIVDTLEYLHRGGRMGGAQRIVGSVLSIKPLLHLDDGRIEVMASVRTKKKAVARALEIIREDTSGKGPMHTAVLHAAAPEEASNFFDEVNSQFHPVENMLAEVSPVIGAHVGPGLVGLAYYTEP